MIRPRVWLAALASLVLAACRDGVGQAPGEEEMAMSQGVWVLCEGNFNSGNSSLSFYWPAQQRVENGVFRRVNDRRLGDTGQSLCLWGNRLFIPVENSGIVWAVDARTARVEGQLTAGQAPGMSNPRYVHVVSETKAYVTDLFAPYITIFDPRTMQPLGSIPTGQAPRMGHNSTENMVQVGHLVFANCWSYSNKILAIDTRTDRVTDSLALGSWQPKSMAADAMGKLWVITDGGYQAAGQAFGDNVPHLYRIDPATMTVEADLALDPDDAGVQIAASPDGMQLYVLNNDIYRMDVATMRLPVRPFITAPTDERGRRHKLYALGVDPRNGDVYVADAVDYAQGGVVHRFSASGELVHQFRVGITPNSFAFQ